MRELHTISNCLNIQISIDRWQWVCLLCCNVRVVIALTVTGRKLVVSAGSTAEEEGRPPALSFL